MNTHPGRRRIAPLLSLLLTLVPSTLQAWSTTPCGADPSRRLAFANDQIWELALVTNSSSGSPAYAEVQAAMQSWNAIDGALDLLHVSRQNYTLCGAPQGEITTGLDDGTCMSWSGNRWGPAQTGSTIFWHDDCEITQVISFVNSNVGLRGDALQNTFVHELGHVLYYDHNWSELSLMGYAYAGTAPMIDPTARDHSYLRHIFPESHLPTSRLVLSRFAQLDELGGSVRPGSASYGHFDDPLCQGQPCLSLATGEQVDVVVTLENVGAAAMPGELLMSLTLGGVSLGEWQVAPLPAEYFMSMQLRGTLPADNTLSGAQELVVEVREQGSGALLDTISYGMIDVPCTPDCSGKSCGSDGCGGVCGVCEPGMSCAMERACVTAALDPPPMSDMGGTPEDMNANPEDMTRAKDADMRDPSSPAEMGEGADMSEDEEVVVIVAPETRLDDEGCHQLPLSTPSGAPGVGWFLLALLGVPTWRRRRAR